MRHLIQGRLYFLIVICILTPPLATSQSSDKMMIVIIDGARYGETFGDPALGLTASGVSCPPMAALRREYVNKLIS